MFGLAKKKSTVPMVIEKPKPHLVVVENNPIEAYEAVSSQVGFLPQQLIELKLLAYFESKKMSLFKFKDVFKYMCSKAGDQSKTWHWIPLRQKDNFQKGWGWDGTYSYFCGGYCGGYRAVEQPYPKLIPANILNQVKDIEQSISHDLNFFVTDYAVANPDPFIAVTVRHSSNLFIFGVWDEPDFGII